MQNKAKRQIAIKEAIQQHNITKQEELLQILITQGFELTQATLSRDIKELNIATKHDALLGHIYFIPEGNSIEQDQVTELKDAISLKISKNLAVLKTKPGFANSVAAIIDNNKLEFIIGTVAGNDTIIMVIDDKLKKKEFLDALSKAFKNILSIYKP